MVQELKPSDLAPEPDISNLVIEDNNTLSDLASEPDISDLVIEDDTPVDNFRSEKQQRLLTEVLYSSWVLPTETFIVAANVGVFHSIGLPAIVPDVFLSLDVTMPDDWKEKKNRTYFAWQFGKTPDVVIEIVSNLRGNELGSKLRDYARMGVGYYAVFDPLQLLSESPLRTYKLEVRRYIEMESFWFEQVGLGLMLWEGEFEGKQDTWLRWCDREGNVLPTGAERAIQAEAQAQQAQQAQQQAEERATQAEERAAQLAAKLRALGIDPDE